jgi:phosphoribosyl-ATP pyrophosphohydrolase/phosphoribosyl-AMP cyclohydrolase
VTKVKQKLKFDQNGLIPAIIQDRSGQVLMLAYMNQEALDKTLSTGLTWFYSRSRKQLWQKGETSGHVQQVVEVTADCDYDSLLITVDQVGPGACHEGYRSCFHYPVQAAANREQHEQTFDPAAVYNSQILHQLYALIEDRKRNPQGGSYTNYLFEKGIDKILKKVGEETAEVIIGAKNADPGELIYEVSDLLYHLLVLLVEKNVALDQIWQELESRRK